MIDFEDDNDDYPLMYDTCPNCDSVYDEIDYEYQICSDCGYNSNARPPVRHKASMIKRLWKMAIGPIWYKRHMDKKRGYRQALVRRRSFRPIKKYRNDNNLPF